MAFYKDRKEAGNILASQLISKKITGQIILGLARGGVVVAQVMASELHLPWDVLVVKKIPAPGNPELAIGAVALNNISVIHEDLAKSVGADPEYINEQIKELENKILQKTALYRAGRDPLSVSGLSVIITDDGAATGATIEAAVAWVKKSGAKDVMVALPIASVEVKDRLATMVDKLVILDTPEDFSAVGQFYNRFEQVEDVEVVKMMKAS